MSNKICNLFDWSNPLDHKTFYQFVNEIFICNEDYAISPTVDKNLIDVCLKQIAFFIFDMNVDNAICEYDLFSVLRGFSDKFFIDCLDQDIKDIRTRLDLKKARNDMGLKEDDNDFQITDVVVYL